MNKINDQYCRCTHDFGFNWRVLIKIFTKQTDKNLAKTSATLYSYRIMFDFEDKGYHIHKPILVVCMHACPYICCVVHMHGICTS